MSYTKVSNNDRRKTARRLRDAANCRNVQISPSALGRLIKAEDRSYRGILRTLADLIEPAKIDSGTSDGCHSFGELYHHRAVLFSVIVAMFPERAWKSRLHADGTMLEGMFTVGIETPDGQATYHFREGKHWDLFQCSVLECARMGRPHPGAGNRAYQRPEARAGGGEVRRRLRGGRMIDRDPLKCCPCCGTTEHWHIPRTDPRLAAYGSSFTAPRAGRTETATRWTQAARDQWNRGPIQIRAEVA